MAACFPARRFCMHALYNKMWKMTNIIDSLRMLRYNQINR